MLLIWMGLAQADSAIATLRVDDTGVALVRVVAAPGKVVSRTAGDLEILAADGSILATAAVPMDVRRAGIIHPEGGGAHVELDAAYARVAIEWPDGARSLRLGSARVGLSVAPPSDPVVAVDVDGPLDERIDILYLGDGYTIDELELWRSDVDRLSTDLLTREPYASYSGLVSVWRVDAASAESGASHYDAGQDIEKDTAYGCYYGCSGTDRLVCCDDDAVVAAIDSSLPAADMTVVLVNDSTYGGMGSPTYCTTYTGTYSDEVQVHELGHHFMELWDEYSYGYAYGGSGAGANCSSESDGSTWSQWLDVEGIGAFTPCSYTDWHSPTNGDCLMYTLYKDFCPVCKEHGLVVMYEHLSELVVDTIPEDEATLEIGEEQVFTATVLGPDDDSMVLSWTLDGADAGSDSELSVTCEDLVSHEIILSVSDPTAIVRLDTDGALTDTHTWTLTCIEAEGPIDTGPQESDPPIDTSVVDSDPVADSTPPAATPPPFEPEPRCGCGGGVALAPWLLALLVIRRRR
ncbi:MAG TPA: M64 family metallopeptidase [Myxococcota bacterium]|nr:M64 family metallopeptidase [Myxococcota bacterium]